MEPSLILIFLLSCNLVSTLEIPGARCLLDERWKGKWFQTGYPQPIHIDSKSMGPKGICLEKAGKDKFLFYHAPSNCHKCVIINERHSNILQYKESQYCEENDLLDTLCSHIPGDGPLYSLFRIDAQPVECPFKGAPFTFTYNRGHGECRDPVSNVDACLESSRLLLRYQACPNIPKTESTMEELECLADWKEGSNHYLIGKLDNRLATNSHEERYRCILYEKIKEHSINPDEGHARTIGYRVAQSGDASCTDISSSTDGARTLILTKVEQNGFVKCKFPDWVLAHHWHTLNGRISVKIHKNSTMHIAAAENWKNSTLLRHSMIGDSLNGFGSQGGSIFKGETRIVCQRRVDISDHHVSIVAQRIEGCKSESVCINIHKRDNHVIEIKIRPKSGYEDKNCGSHHKSSESEVYITLVSSTTSPRRCPQFGKYMTPKVTQASDASISHANCGVGGRSKHNTIFVGCGHRGTMEFHSKCATQEPIVSYSCHGNWEESGTGYLIATPLSRSSNSADRYCFVYSKTEDGLRVYRSSESCRIQQSPGADNFWDFNLIVDGQCAEPLTGKSINVQAQTSLLPFSVILIKLAADLVHRISLMASTSEFSEISRLKYR